MEPWETQREEAEKLHAYNNLFINSPSGFFFPSTHSLLLLLLLFPLPLITALLAHSFALHFTCTKIQPNVFFFPPPVLCWLYCIIFLPFFSPSFQSISFHFLLEQIRRSRNNMRLLSFSLLLLHQNMHLYKCVCGLSLCWGKGWGKKKQ